MAPPDLWGPSSFHRHVRLGIFGQPHEFRLTAPFISPTCAGRAKGHLYPSVYTPPDDRQVKATAHIFAVQRSFPHAASYA